MRELARLPGFLLAELLGRLVANALHAPGFSPLSGPSLEKYVYGRSEYEMLSPVLTCEST